MNVCEIYIHALYVFIFLTCVIVSREYSAYGKTSNEKHKSIILKNISQEHVNVNYTCCVYQTYMGNCYYKCNIGWGCILEDYFDIVLNNTLLVSFYFIPGISDNCFSICTGNYNKPCLLN